VAQHGNELLTQFGSLPLVQQRGLAESQPIDRVKMGRDQLRKQFEHAHDFRPRYLRRLRINGAKRSKERSILQNDRHRNIALKTVGRRRVMSAINRVLRDVVDDDRFEALPDLVADGGFDFQLTAGQ
jgi:hypothetical protein